MFFNLFSRIASGDVEAHVITNGPASPEACHRDGLIIHRVEMKDGVDPLNFISALQFFLKGSSLFLKLQKRLRFDIVQMVGSLPVLALYVALLAKVAGCSSVWGFIGLALRREELKGLHRTLRDRPPWYRLFSSRAAFWLLARLWSRWLDGVIVESLLGVSFLRDIGVDARKIFHIPPGVDLRMFTPRHAARQSPYRIIYASSCYPWKGVFDLLEAFKMILERGAPAELLYVFPGISSELNFISQLEHRITALGLRDRVGIRAGPVNDIEKVIAQADVVACPIQSSAQTLAIPMSLLEGMACGLPAIGTRVGAIPEAIIDGANGYLIEPSIPDALAGAMLKMFAEPARMERMGEESLRLVKPFDVCKSALVLRGMYSALSRRS